MEGLIMKRSEINTIIKSTEDFFSHHCFEIPPWGKWSLDQWKQNKESCDEIFTQGLGWDITDFGSGDFNKCGLTLFTIRNGKFGVEGKTYAEKIMVVEESQVTPSHFHWHKMEDIINRGGGNLVIELHLSDEADEFTNDTINVQIDGITHNIEAGGKVILKPGESICLYPRLYHEFYGEESKGRVLVGEVSMVNDDHNDNYFHKPIGRFPEIEEDEDPFRLLVSDYQKFLSLEN